MAGSSKLQVFWDPHSQPARALVIFCRVNKVDAKEIYINVFKKENLPPEFLSAEINPTHQVPVIDDDGFTLFESAAILKYLAASRGVPDHWYPKDVKRRALVDSVLDWHHSNTRRFADLWSYNQVLAPAYGRPSNLKVIEDSKILAVRALDMLEIFWCKDGPFLCGAEEISIADVQLACELSQLKLLDGPELAELFGPRNRVTKWLNLVEDTLNPVFNEVHTAFYVLIHKKAKNTAGESQG